jgi:MFS family permease
MLQSEKLSEPAQKVVKKFFWFSCMMRGIFMLSNTFLFLFVVDKIGLSRAALVITIAFIIQGLTDYPSGGLGDRIGQKNVLFIAYLFHTIAFGSLLVANTFELFIFIYSFEGLARSLESGALSAWFDSNYKSVALEEDDPNLEIYRVMNMKMEMYIGIFASTMFLLGGLIAYVTFREIVFAFQSGIMVLVGIVSLIYLDNYYEPIKEQKGTYLAMLSGSIELLFSSPRLLVLVIASIIVTIPIILWVELVLFIFYFAYSGSDATAGVFRYVIWIFSSLSIGFSSNYMKKLKIRDNLTKLHIIHPMMFFFIIAIIIYIFPMKNELNLVVMIITIVVFSLTAILRFTGDVMTKEVYLEIIPNNLRNSFYSLIPTLTTIMVAPILPIFGILIDNYGFIVSIVLIGLMEVLGGLIFSLGFILPTTWKMYSNDSIFPASTD